MRESEFLPSIPSREHSYYPRFDRKNGICVTHRLSRRNLSIIVKNGVILDLDLSPDGPALLWIDSKLFAFVNSKSGFRAGEPIYLICKELAKCIPDDYQDLLEGAFALSSDRNNARSLQCALGEVNSTIAVRTKSKHQIMRVPQRCTYTTVNTHKLKALGLYNWWRPRAIPSSRQRYRLTRYLIQMIAQRQSDLTIPLFDDQEIKFSLQPITQGVRMRFTS
jgi:hypothetical protein